VSLCVFRATYYELIKLSPAYRVYFGVDEFITIADNLAEIEATFESIEEGSGAVLHKFIRAEQL
jgi:phytoene desaturase